jgi:hypothetical protein
VKRGLVRLDPAELPAEELHRRLRSVQERLRQAGVVAALIYGDVSRSGDIAYLTNLCIYWNEGILVVPAAGEPAFVTRLSARVHPWMRATSSVRELSSGADLAGMLAERLAGVEAGAVGLVGRAWWPALLVEALAGRLPDRELRDLGGLVRAERLRPAGAELALLRRAGAIAEHALSRAAEDGLSAAERVARAELAGRGAGATDIVVDCDPGPDGAVALEVRVQLLGCCALAARTAPAVPAALDAAWRAAGARLRAGVTRTELRDAAPGWDVDLVPHPDLETRGDHRLPEDLDAPAGEGMVAALRLATSLPGGRRMVTARTYLVGAGAAEGL